MHGISLNKINFNLLEHSKQYNRDFHAVKTTLEYFSALGPEDEMDVCVKVGKIGTYYIPNQATAERRGCQDSSRRQFDKSKHREPRSSLDAR